MASSSENESDNSTEEIAPARRTRSGRATAPKPARRGKRRGGTPARSTRNTRKSARVQHEEDVDEMLEQDQGSELDELKDTGLPDDALQFESGTVEPVFADLAEQQFPGDEFRMEDTYEVDNGLKGVEQEEEVVSDSVETLEKPLAAGSENDSEDERSVQNDKKSSSEDEEDMVHIPPKQMVQAEDEEMSNPAESHPDNNSEQEQDDSNIETAMEATEQDEDTAQDAEEEEETKPEVAQSEDSSSAASEEKTSEPEITANQETEPTITEEQESTESQEATVNQEEEPMETQEPEAETVETPTVVKEEVKQEVQEPQPEVVPEKKRKRRGFSDAPDQECPPVKKTGKDEPAVNGDQTKEDGTSSPDQGGDKAEQKRKTLPELGKYWKAVKEDSSDFTGWTYLLQYVDQESDVEAAREAYDAFLSLYPYCYGYWRKYADYEKKKGSPEFCDQVFERGLKAIPLSVDLWLHYLNHCKTSHPGDEAYIRTQFERALDSCGMEFRSDRLWESYIKWETENKNLQHVTAIYDRLLRTPTQGYTSHFDNFETLAKAHLPQKLLSVDEFLTLRKEWLAARQAKEEQENNEGEEKKESDDAASVEQKQKEEITALREKLIETRKELHKETVAAVADRWNFEEGIKRPYFHVKPLEKSQLRNWREYLEYEIEQGNRERIIILYERCLIACALYEEFWVRFLQYLEGQKDDKLIEKIRNVYERACTIHHAKKANLHLHWAAFEEKEQNWDRAAGILESLEKHMPGLLQLAYRRINLERRRGNLAQASTLYEGYVTSFKNQTISTNLAIKHARFCSKVKSDLDGAISVLSKALEKDKANSRLYLQLIDLHMSRIPMDVEAVVAVFDRFLSSEASASNKATFAQRKLEFLEDFGQDITCVLKAQEEQQQYQKLARDAKKETQEGKTSDSNNKKKSSSDWTPPIPSQPPPPHPPNQYGTQYNQNYPPPYGPQQQNYGQGNYSQYQGNSGSGDPNNYYQNWSGYSGYNQGWGNYNYY